MRRRLSIARLVSVTCLLLGVHAPTAMSKSRAETFERVRDYTNWPLNVQDINIYPLGPCYPGPGNLGAHLQVGYYEGVVYGYGLNSDIIEVLFGLPAGKGAGCWSELYFLDGGSFRGCLRDSVVGIDCSAFVSRAWGIPRVGTCALASSAYSAPVTGTASVKPGDIMVKCDSHVMLVASTVENDLVDTWEAVGGNYGRCRVLRRSYQALVNSDHLLPRVSNELKDDPAADILSFEALPEGSAVRVAWSTLMEDQTAAFVILRSSDPNGPFSPISSEIPAQGSTGSGASYEFLDASPSELATYYQLREIETNGRELIHGVASAGIAQQRGSVPRPRPR